MITESLDRNIAGCVIADLADIGDVLHRSKDNWGDASETAFLKNGSATMSKLTFCPSLRVLMPARSTR
jgi:hypothetical protein